MHREDRFVIYYYFTVQYNDEGGPNLAEVLNTDTVKVQRAPTQQYFEFPRVMTSAVGKVIIRHIPETF